MVRRLPNPPRQPGTLFTEQVPKRAPNGWDFSSAQAAAQSSPWQPGDLIEWVAKSKLRRGIVVEVEGRFIAASGQWIPRLKVQPVTDSGKWSATWVRVWPGEILGIYSY